eukprot:TRINITY_DN1262_c0_g1_i17.p1 TRINITY_DN1262_c0_g1~~TRINITY_DN1262_c0_g1_i17.p1  ORF type:complete len:155 (+),score=15.31 TRINITY_DN1262_c0_g1_i17:152-616(+)
MESAEALQRYFINVSKMGQISLLSRLIQDAKNGKYNMDLINGTVENGSTALHETVRTGKRKAVMVLLDEGSADPNRKNEEGQTALHLACFYGHVFVCRKFVLLELIHQLVQYLVKHGADCDTRDKDGNSPMICLAMGNAYVRCRFCLNCLSSTP